MKRKSRILLVSMLLSLFFVEANAQSIVIQEGVKESSVDLWQIRKVCFVDGQMVVELLNGVTSSYVISGITKVNFRDSGTKVESEIASSTTLLHYSPQSPNQLVVNCNAGELIEIYSMEGKKMLEVKQSTEGGTIEISQLPRNTYIIRVKDKAAKIIKL